MRHGCEVRDYVVPAIGAVFVRENNEAANVEHVRRGQPEQVLTSGELVGDAIMWIPEPAACGSGWVQLGTL
jgi:hypothetical protein